MADEEMYMTLSVGGKIKKNGMKRRRKNRGGSGIMKTVKKCFLQLFSHGKTQVIPLSLLQWSERAWWDLELTTCVCLVTLVNDPNYLPPCCEQSINN